MRKYGEYTATKSIDEIAISETAKSTKNTNSTSDNANNDSMENTDSHFKFQHVTEQTDPMKTTFRRIDFSKGVTARPLNFSFETDLQSEQLNSLTSKSQSKNFEPIIESMENSQMTGGSSA